MKLLENMVKKPKSFTLIELLVSLAIVSFALAVVYATTVSIIDSREKLVKSGRVFSNVLVVLNELKSELESAFSSPGKRSFVLGETGYFGYTYDTLSFLTYYRGGRKVEYAFVPDEETETATLVKRVVDEFSERNDVSPQYIKILENVRMFDVKVFDGVSWQERWDSDNVPILFDITLVVVIDGKEYPFHIAVERSYSETLFSPLKRPRRRVERGRRVEGGRRSILPPFFGR